MEFDAAEANRLYWETEQSVAEIAQQLDISRRALYGAVQPLPAGEACPDCGGPLVFENRSARRSDIATCEACSGDSQEDAVGTQASRGESVADVPLSQSAGDGDDRMRAAGAALAGLALGAILTLSLVPRR